MVETEVRTCEKSAAIKSLVAVVVVEEVRGGSLLSVRLEILTWGCAGWRFG